MSTSFFQTFISKGTVTNPTTVAMAGKMPTMGVNMLIISTEDISGNNSFTFHLMKYVVRAVVPTSIIEYKEPPIILSINGLDFGISFRLLKKAFLVVRGYGALFGVKETLKHNRRAKNDKNACRIEKACMVARSQHISEKICLVPKPAPMHSPEPSPPIRRVSVIIFVLWSGSVVITEDMLQ